MSLILGSKREFDLFRQEAWTESGRYVFRSDRPVRRFGLGFVAAGIVLAIGFSQTCAGAAYLLLISLVGMVACGLHAQMIVDPGDGTFRTSVGLFAFQKRRVLLIPQIDSVVMSPDGSGTDSFYQVWLKTGVTRAPVIATKNRKLAYQVFAYLHEELEIPRGSEDMVFDTTARNWAIVLLGAATLCVLLGISMALAMTKSTGPLEPICGPWLRTTQFVNYKGGSSAMVPNGQTPLILVGLFATLFALFGCLQFMTYRYLSKP